MRRNEAGRDGIELARDSEGMGVRPRSARLFGSPLNCLGILRLAKQYTAQRIERAAARALHFRTPNSGSVASTLKNNLDQLPLPGEEPQQALPLHENIRGGGYYH